MDDSPIPNWASEELTKGKCAIGRFRGQTCIYVPAPLSDRLDAETVYMLAAEIFTEEKMDEFKMRGVYHIYKTETYCQFEVPTSLNRDYARQEENPDYRKPDELVKKIMALAR
jgi:hypothetical protein